MIAAIFFLVLVLAGCSAFGKKTPLHGYPHSPGDVEAGQQRQLTRGEIPRLETELIRRRPMVHERTHDGVGDKMMPVYLVPHAQGDVWIGGQWVHVPSKVPIKTGPRAVPSTPELQPVDLEKETPEPPSLVPGEHKTINDFVPKEMKKSFERMQQQFGIKPKQPDGR